VSEIQHFIHATILTATFTITASLLRDNEEELMYNFLSL